MEWSLSQDNYYDTSVKKCNVIDFSFTSPSFPVQWSVRVPVYVNIGICSYLINRCFSFALVETSVYRKATNNNIYINWYSYTPSNWKNWPLKNLIKRAKLISSTKLLLRNEIDYTKNVYRKQWLSTQSRKPYYLVRIAAAIRSRRCGN